MCATTTVSLSSLSEAATVNLIAFHLLLIPLPASNFVPMGRPYPNGSHSAQAVRGNGGKGSLSLGIGNGIKDVDR